MIKPGTYETNVADADSEQFEAWAAATPGVELLGGVPEGDGRTWWAVRVTKRLRWDAPVGSAPSAIVGADPDPAGDTSGDDGAHGKGGPGLLGLLDMRQLVTGLIVAVAGAYLVKRAVRDD